jgi:hypothetical protein
MCYLWTLTRACGGSGGTGDLKAGVIRVAIPPVFSGLK